MKTSVREGAARSAQGRREFLAWLAAVPAVAACTASTRDGGGGGAGPDEEHEVGHGEPTEPAPSGVYDDVDGETYGQTEQGAHACRATTRDAEGPYFTRGAPVRSLRIAEPDEPGVRLLVEGRLFGPDCRTPLRGYALDLWQADKDGSYASAGTSFRLRGKVVTDTFGRYRFETILPGRYGDAAGIRPAHIHAKVLTPQGNTLLTTQIYFAGDPYLGQADYCTRSGTCNSADVARVLSLASAVVSGTPGKRARFDAFLPRT